MRIRAIGFGVLSILASTFLTSAQQPAIPTQSRPGAPMGRPGPMAPPRHRTAAEDSGTARIRGRIVGGDSGQALGRAIVQLWGETLEEGRSTTTDETGRYEFKDLPAGRFTVTAGKAGYVRMQFGQRRPFGGAVRWSFCPARRWKGSTSTCPAAA
jgi:hypothetical protein